MNDFKLKALQSNLKQSGIIHLDLPVKFLDEKSIHCRIVFLHGELVLNTSFDLEISGSKTIDFDFLFSKLEFIKQKAEDFKSTFDLKFEGSIQDMGYLTSTASTDQIDLFVLRQIFTAFNIFNDKAIDISKLTNVSERIAILHSIGYAPYSVIKDILFENSFIYSSIINEIAYAKKNLV